MTKSFLLIVSALFYASSMFGQADTTLFGVYDNVDDFEFGRFYIQVYIPPSFEIKKDRVFLLDNNQHLLTNLEEGKDYAIQTEVIEICPEFTKWQIGEPQFDTIIEERFYRDKSYLIPIEPMPGFKNKISYPDISVGFPKEVNFKYIPIDDTILVNAIEPCMSVTEYTALIGTMVEIPTTYDTTRSKIVKRWGKWYRKVLPSERLLRREKIVFKHMEVFPETFPQLLDTFQIIQFLDTTLYQKATYTIVERQVMTRHNQGYFSEWRECFCHSKDSPILVLLIQEALRQKGYKVDLTNEFDDKTRRALILFQKENNLPQELWNFKTLAEMLEIGDL